MASRFEVKVCGNRFNIVEVDACRPDYLGVIFHPGSPRHAGGESIPEDVSTPRVAVFVNAGTQTVEKEARRIEARIVQLHGTESPDDCAQLAEKGFEVWKAVGITSAGSFEGLDSYRGCVSKFLFDTRCEGYGGSGRQFDWRLLDAYTLDIPFMLAGGIGVDDARRLTALSHPLLSGFDINSRFEISPGLKDISAIINFISEIRSV